MNGAERQINPASVFLCSLCVKWLVEYKFLRSNSSSSRSGVPRVPPVKSLLSALASGDCTWSHIPRCAHTYRAFVHLFILC